MSNKAQTMTPYAAAKIANAELVEAGIEKVLPPQMFYTYTKKGYIESTEVAGKRVVTRVQLDKWLKGYIQKLQAKDTDTSAEQVDEDQLELDFVTPEKVEEEQVA